MGILSEIGAQVVSVFKADTTHLVAGLRQVKGEERALIKDRIAGIEESNAAIGEWKMTALEAAAGVAAAYEIGKVGFETYTKTIALQGATAGISIEKLREASGGLRSEMELLKLAQAGHQGAWKLNGDQMARVVEDMRALVKEGFNSEAVLEGITTTLTKGTTRGLKEFGIVVKQNIDETSTLKDVMAALDAQADKVGHSYGMVGDDVRRAGVKVEDAFHGMKMAIGELVVAMGPMIDSLAKVVALVGQLPDMVSAIAHQIPGGSTLTKAWKYVNPMTSGPALIGLAGGEARDLWSGMINDHHEGDLNDAFGSQLNQTQFLLQNAPGFQQWTAQMGDLLMFKKQIAEREAAQREAALAHADDLIKMASGRAEWFRLKDQNSRALTFPLRSGLATAEMWGGRLLAGVGMGPLDQPTASGDRRGPYDYVKGAGYGPDWQSTYGIGTNAAQVGGGVAWSRTTTGEYEDPLLAGNRQMNAKMERAQVAFADEKAGARESKLEKMFGPLSDFNAYASAFGLLQNAVTSAFSAWVDGSESIGKALKRAIADGLKAEASNLLIQALKHGAYALGSLAFGDLPGAARHGLAAAEFGLAAVAAGAAAKAMGGSSGGGVASAGGYHAGSSSAGISQVNPSINITWGDSFEEESPRSKSIRWQRASQRAARYASGSTGVSF